MTLRGFQITDWRLAIGGWLLVAIALIFSGTALAAGNVGYASSVPAFFRPEHVENVLHVLFQPTASAESLSGAAEHRLADDRPKLDRDALTSAGFAIVESKHLLLVTDLPAESVASLPPLADALFEELQRQLGPLAPAVDGSTFQVTGFLMQAAERFDSAGLLPPEQFPIRHGRNIGQRFWINNQTADYYRRHLLLHEFTHCFLMCEHGMLDIPPLWYTEGIAEVFATHVLAEPISDSRFGVLPETREGFEGWGRIEELKRGFNIEPSEEPLDAGFTSLSDVRFPAGDSFVEDQQYAQAWALVWLIRNHPQLQPHFRAFNQVRSRAQFRDAESAVPDAVWDRMQTVWPLFLDSVTEGIDIRWSFPSLSLEPHPWPEGANWTFSEDHLVSQTWQSMGAILPKGATVTIRCDGRYTLHDDPKPWISEPQGITIDYHRGRPLGEAIAMLVSPDGQFASRRIPIGRERTITIPHDAELWVQINDDESGRVENDGLVRMTVSGQREP